MAKLSVSLMPVFFSTSSSFHRVRFLGVVRAGGIAGGGTDAAIFFLDQIVGGEVFRFAVAPFFADAFVQIFGERFGQAVGQRFGHDGVVVVVVGFEFLDQFLEAMAAGDGEGADVILAAGAFGRDEIGEAEARLCRRSFRFAGAGNGMSSGPCLRDSSV